MKTFLQRHPRWVFLLAIAGALAIIVFWWCRPGMSITWATCHKIRAKMTEAEVEALIGGPAGEYRTRELLYSVVKWVGRDEEAPPLDLGDKALYWRSWKGDEGCILIFFNKESGRVVQWGFDPVASVSPSWLERAKAYLINALPF